MESPHSQAAGERRPRVSLIVPVRNERAYIDGCLEALAGQVYPNGEVEIIVVDGQSDDGTVQEVLDFAERSGAMIRLLANPARTMPEGLNLGITHAGGEYIGVISGHSVVAHDHVARSVNGLARTGAWAIGGRIQRVADTPVQRAIAVATASPLAVGGARHNYATAEGPVEAVFPGLWPRWVFDRVGLFDPDMIANEDNEFSLRIRRAGGIVWLDPSIVVQYHPRSTYVSLFHQYRRYGFGKVKVFRKHRGGLRFRHLVPGVAVGFGVVLAPLATVSMAAYTILGVTAAAYLALVTTASMLNRPPGVPIWRVMLAIWTMHAGYGIGTWQGIGVAVARTFLSRGRSSG